MSVAMNSPRLGFPGCIMLCAAGSALANTQLGVSNPLKRDASAVAAGQTLYREKCAVCHGQDATGGMAANLRHSGKVRRGADGTLFGIIREGFPGSTMPPQPDMTKDQIWQLVTFLHSISRPGQTPPLPGDEKAGRELFTKVGCASCHQVDGTGGFLGPELNSIAAQKASEEIRKAVLEPSAELKVGFETVSANMANGTKIEGVVKNEDLFTMQVLTREGEHETIEKSRIKELSRPARSVMPGNYGQKLSDEELRNLLAFLDRQRDPYVPARRGWGNY